MHLRIKLFSEITLAFGFLTVLPVPALEYQPGALSRAGRWFPLVGLAIGLLLAAAYWLLTALFPPLLTGVLITVCWAALTGGLHLDGLADCCDGLLAPTTRERRLEIMRDPRTGAFAVIGLVLALLLKATAIASLTMPWSALILAPAWGRWLLLLVARQPSARAGGLGVEFAAGLSHQTLGVAAFLPIVVFCFFLTWRTLGAIIAAFCATCLVLRFAKTRLGGVTGDVYGLVVELSELVILLSFAASRNSVFHL